MLLLGAVLLCVAVLVFLAGCDEVKKHKILTFFFDGVPPLGLEYLDPNSPEYAQQLEELEKVSMASRHETGKGCKHCHESGILKETIPDLCYTCHDDYMQQGAYVHAPVLVGDCLFCHDEHSSGNPALLRYPIPEMCYRCHDNRAVDLIEGHSDKRYKMCTTCHLPHVSSHRKFLKSGKVKAKAQKKGDISTNADDSEQTAPKENTDLK